MKNTNCRLSKLFGHVWETKDVENKTELRGTEEMKINCARKFFSQLTIDGYTVEFHEQLNKKKIKEIIVEVLKRN